MDEGTRARTGLPTASSMAEEDRLLWLPMAAVVMEGCTKEDGVARRLLPLALGIASDFLRLLPKSPRCGRG